jgi:hypothetical protein
MTYNIDAENNTHTTYGCPAASLPLKASVLSDIIAKERLDLVVLQEFLSKKRASDGRSVNALEEKLKTLLPPGWCLVVVHSACELDGGEVSEEGDSHAFAWDPSRLTLCATPTSHHRSRRHFKRPPVVADFAINRGAGADARDLYDGTLTVGVVQVEFSLPPIP